MLTVKISPLLSVRWALYVNVKCAPQSKQYNFLYFYKSNLNLNNTRLHSDNAGADEWSTHCRGCVPLAKEAQRAERDRPSSAKIRKILQLLREIDERSEGVEKTIIFSQFTSMLDLIEPFLNEKGIKYVRCELILLEMFCAFSDHYNIDDGSMNPKDREAALAKIKSSSTTRVILISFKAGSTGA